MDSSLTLRSQIQVIRTVLREYQEILDKQLQLDIEAVLSRVESMMSQLGDGGAPIQVDLYSRADRVFRDSLQALLSAVRSGDLGGLRELITVLDDSYGEFVEETSQKLSTASSLATAEEYNYIGYFRALSSGWKQEHELRSALDSARDALVRLSESERQAEESAAKAADAAGETGRNSLAEHFQKYANDELRTANRFRWATLVSICLAAGVTLTGPYAADANSAEIVRHALQVLALGGIGTFLGSQSSNHRRTGNWARSIEVQLRSFPAFMDPIEDSSTIASLYDQLGARILSAAPGVVRGRGSSPALAQLLEPLMKRLP